MGRYFATPYIMEIKSTFTNPSGQTLDVIYKEEDPRKDLDGKILQGVHAFCFCGDKLVIVFSENKGYWTPPGGGIEHGETLEQAVIREVREETNMNVLKQQLIGYQDIHEPGRIVRQFRSVCIVKPVDEFGADPDGDITEIKLIDPKDYKEYFDWGPVGDRLMEQALLLRSGI